MNAEEKFLTYDLLLTASILPQEWKRILWITPA